MAAGLYLLLMWGYLSLPTPQLFAVFAALLMSIALLFWVGEARVDVPESQSPNSDTEDSNTPVHTDRPDEQPLSITLLKLESLKEELAQQYAQLGRDQSSINKNGLGTWHRNPDDRQRDQ